jgi:hypothetical protein
MGSGIGVRNPISSTMKPLDGGVSTHRWARAPSRGLTVVLFY